MNRPLFAALALGLFGMNAATAATAAADAAALTDAQTVRQPAPVLLAPDRPLPPRTVVAPPKPRVETVVQPGLDKLQKHERLTDVLRARKRAGGTGLVVAE